MPALTHDDANRRTVGTLPGALGIHFTHVGERETRTELVIGAMHMSPNGYLHAGTAVTLADTSAGFACLATLPAGATNFTTIELKTNFLGTAREGTLDCLATAVHLGRMTQVWDATVTHRETGRTIAVFRCTQMILYDRPTR